MTRYIVIKTQFEAIHQWKDCPIEEVEYLKYPHRHLFYVTMKWKVMHNDREKEFIQMKHKVDRFVRDEFEFKDIGGMSCEGIAEKLLKEFDADFVSVFEDDENGAEIYKV